MLLGIHTLLASRYIKERMLAKTYQEIEETYHKVNDLTFLEERKKGRVTEMLWMDYIQVTITIKRLYAKGPDKLSMPLIQSEIPNNRWLPILQENMEKLGKER